MYVSPFLFPARAFRAVSPALSGAKVCLPGNLIVYFYDHAAVRFIDLKFLAVHNKKPFLIINREKCDTAGLMVDRSDMLVIRKNADILGIAAAYGKTA